MTNTLSHLWFHLTVYTSSDDPWATLGLLLPPSDTQYTQTTQTLGHRNGCVRSLYTPAKLIDNDNVLGRAPSVRSSLEVRDQSSPSMQI